MSQKQLGKQNKNSISPKNHNLAKNSPEGKKPSEVNDQTQAKPDPPVKVEAPINDPLTLLKDTKGTSKGKVKSIPETNLV